MEFGRLGGFEYCFEYCFGLMSAEVGFIPDKGSCAPPGEKRAALGSCGHILRTSLSCAGALGSTTVETLTSALSGDGSPAVRRSTPVGGHLGSTSTSMGSASRTESRSWITRWPGCATANAFARTRRRTVRRSLSACGDRCIRRQITGTLTRPLSCSAMCSSWILNRRTFSGNGDGPTGNRGVPVGWVHLHGPIEKDSRPKVVALRRISGFRIRFLMPGRSGRKKFSFGRCRVCVSADGGLGRGLPGHLGRRGDTRHRGRANSY